MNCTRIGMDISKNVFVLHGVNAQGKTILKQKLKRKQMHEYFAQLPKTEIAMEACGTAHYWSRVLQSYGHTVKLIAPQHVKPYVQGGKNDANDAAAICEAASRPHMKYVPTKTAEQQAIQSLLRIREGIIKDRTALINRVRGLMAEFGIVCENLGVANARKTLYETIGNDQLPAALLAGLRMQSELLALMDEQLNQLETQLKQHAKQNDTIQRLMAIEGIGILTATAIECSVVDAQMFGNSRSFGAWIGLTPRQNSSGGKEKLSGITKRGDGYLRYLLIHGARTVVRYCTSKTDERSLWLQSLLLRKHPNVVAVALANKMARIIWAMLTRGEAYRIPKMLQVETC